MNVGDHIRCAIDDFAAGKTGSSMMHACSAVDGTAARRAGGRTTGLLFKSLIREYHWLIEAMGRLPNLDETRFSNVPFDKVPRPDFADVIYKYHRCSHAHGQEPPFGFELIPCVGKPASQIVLAEGILRLPDDVVFALLSVAVLDPANDSGLHVPPGYFLTLGEGAYLIDEWWGRAEDFLREAQRNPIPRVTLKNLWGESEEHIVPEQMRSMPGPANPEQPHVVIKSYGELPPGDD